MFLSKSIILDGEMRTRGNTPMFTVSANETGGHHLIDQFLTGRYVKFDYKSASKQKTKIQQTCCDENKIQNSDGRKKTKQNGRRREVPSFRPTLRTCARASSHMLCPHSELLCEPSNGFNSLLSAF